MEQGTRRRPNSVPGTVRQTIYSEISGTSPITGTIPDDNTIPQNTEGTEVFNVPIQPSKIGNKILVEIDLYMTEDANTNGATIIALFQNSDADAIASTAQLSSTPTAFIHGGDHTIRKEITATSTSVINLKVRAGGSDGGACTLNRTSDNANFFDLGGTITTSIKITEIEV